MPCWWLLGGRAPWPSTAAVTRIGSFTCTRPARPGRCSLSGRTCGGGGSLPGQVGSTTGAIRSRGTAERRRWMHWTLSHRADPASSSHSRPALQQTEGRVPTVCTSRAMPRAANRYRVLGHVMAIRSVRSARMARRDGVLGLQERRRRPFEPLDSRCACGHQVEIPGPT